MTLRVAIAGFGAIGKVVAQRLDRGIEGLALAAVAARDVARAEAAIAGFLRPVPVLPLARAVGGGRCRCRVRPGCGIARARRAGARERAHCHGVELRGAARQFRSGRFGALQRRPHSRAKRSTAGAGRSNCSRRRGHLERQYDYEKAAAGPIGRTLSCRPRRGHYRIGRAQTRLQRHGARGRPRVSRQRQCRRGIGARRVSGPIARRSRSGPTRPSLAIFTASRSRLQPRAYRCRSRTCRRTTIRALAA